MLFGDFSAAAMQAAEAAAAAVRSTDNFNWTFITLYPWCCNTLLLCCDSFQHISNLSRLKFFFECKHIKEHWCKSWRDLFIWNVDGSPRVFREYRLEERGFSAKQRTVFYYIFALSLIAFPNVYIPPGVIRNKIFRSGTIVGSHDNNRFIFLHCQIAGFL